MKSVHITNYYHKNSGGISTSFNNLMAAAERHKRLVRLIVPGESESIEDVNPYARIYYVPANYSPLFDKRYRLMKPWQYMIPDSIIRRILLEEMPDIVEITDKYTLSLFGTMVRRNKFHKLGRPILVHFSCERMDDNVASFMTKGRFGKWLARRVMGNYILPSYDYHIANSAYTAAEFYESAGSGSEIRSRSRSVNAYWRFFRAPLVSLKERIFICPRGVDASLFTPTRRSEVSRKAMLERANVPEGAFVLLYAGRISPEKNIPLLSEMMTELNKDASRDYRLLVAGDGPLSDWLVKQGEQHFPDRLRMLGHLDKETLADLYANADAFVHPNPKEPFGIAPLEAMASGVPTVAPNSGGILSYADDTNAWLVEPNGESFSAAVKDISNDPSLSKVKAEKAVRTALSNTREASTNRLFETYDQIYEDFHNHIESFTDAEKIKSFDFVNELLIGDPAAPSPDNILVS